MTLRRVLLALLGVVALLALYVAGAWYGLYGRHEGAGDADRRDDPGGGRQRARSGAARRSGGALGRAARQADPLRRPPRPHHLLERRLPRLAADAAGRGRAPGVGRLRLRALLFVARLLVAERPRRGEHAAALERDEGSDPPVQCRRGRRSRIPTSSRSSAGSGARSARRRTSTTDTRTWCCARPPTTTVPARPIGAAGLATDALRNAGTRIPRLLPFADFENRQRYWNFIDLPRRDRRGAALRGRRLVEGSRRRLLRVGRDARGSVPQARRVGRRGDRDPARQHVGLLLAAGHHLGQAARRARSTIRRGSS